METVIVRTMAEARTAFAFFSSQLFSRFLARLRPVHRRICCTSTQPKLHMSPSFLTTGVASHSETGCSGELDNLVWPLNCRFSNIFTSSSDGQASRRSSERWGNFRSVSLSGKTIHTFQTFLYLVSKSWSVVVDSASLSRFLFFRTLL